VLAQAALETGWGSKVMETPDGGSSFNLFGIKAANGWDGNSVTKPTLEFEDGVARRETAAFRAYDSVSKTLDDYADFLSNSPRYERAKNTGNDVAAFAGALADGGYATDPDYAKKITDIFNGPTMRRVLQSLGDAASAGR
jgi:flagellar protein FlgJ